MRRLPVFLLAVAGLLATGVAFSPAAQAATHSFRATLGGVYEVPPTGSAVTGSVLVTVDDGANTVCSYLALENIDIVDITAMHIHNAPAGVNGGIVVPFSPVAPSACTGGVDAGLIAALIAAPDQYYFNIHTAAYPGGEGRGQLEPVTPGLPTPLTGGLSGAAEVPPNATPTAGVVGVLVDSGTNLVCVAFSLQNQTLANITAMHIHQAPAGSNGSSRDPLHGGELGVLTGRRRRRRRPDRLAHRLLLQHPLGRLPRR